MTLTLDEATEALLQRHLASGRFENADALLIHALALVEAEASEPEGDWLYQNREEIRQIVAEGRAEYEREETYSAEQARTILAKRRAERVLRAA